ncbi:MAG: histidine phosphatase family protein [Gammaproteobacteria bacterium]|nr:histidine phosphatase family protein [Gammaproteobacteria bacterium]
MPKVLLESIRVGALLVPLLLVLAVEHSWAETSDADELLALLSEDDYFALIRHALAPGTGDPEQFEVDDCRTQRNLDGAGRRQAMTMGQRLRDAGITQALVYSSQWCRCLETAELLAIGPVIPLPSLNSFFQARHRAETQTTELKSWLSEQPLDLPTVLSTHQVNITALTDVFPNSGEILIVYRDADNNYQLVGSVVTAIE